MSDEKDCICDEDPKSCCDGDRTNNMWVEGGDTKLGTGICLLDTMSPDQVIYTLQHNPNAAKDLLRVTSDPVLREYALTVPLLSTKVEVDEEQKEINRHDEAGSIPFYAIFRGQPPFNQ
jgi:hypothetical protein